MPMKDNHGPRALGRRSWTLLALLLPILVLTACQESPSLMTPASPGARTISDLGWQLFAIAAVVFVAVEAMLIYIILRFRNKGETGEPRQVYGHHRLEIAWTAAPGIVLIGVLWTTFQTMALLLPAPADALVVRVTGHQWWWQVEYPDLGIVTANEYHVPVGTNVRVDLVSGDVIHSYWAAELGPKMDVLPEHQNTTWFNAEKPDAYRGFCAEFCGVQHANMGFFIVAEEQADFDAWVQAQQQPAAQAADAAAQQGAEAFNASGCGGCHTVAGTAAQGTAGPNLTHVGGRRMIAANVLDNTPENMARWLANPQAVKPGNKMPVLPLGPDRVSQIAAYLESLE